MVGNLNKAIGKMDDSAYAAFIIISTLLKREMMRNEPTVPKDMGILRNSYFTVTARKTEAPMQDETGSVPSAESFVKTYKFPILVLGFSASYAVFVHEMVEGEGKTINWSLPGSGSKFLEKALYNNKDKILEIIKKKQQEAIK